MKDTYDLGRFHLPIKMGAQSHSFFWIALVPTQILFRCMLHFQVDPCLHLRNTYFSLNNVRSCTLQDEYTACNKGTKAWLYTPVLPCTTDGTHKVSLLHCRVCRLLLGSVMTDDLLQARVVAMGYLLSFALQGVKKPRQNQKPSLSLLYTPSCTLVKIFV